MSRVSGSLDITQRVDADLMRRYEVSSRVNLVKNDDLECAEPVVRAEAAAGPIERTP